MRTYKNQVEPNETVKPSETQQNPIEPNIKQ